LRKKRALALTTEDTESTVAFLRFFSVVNKKHPPLRWIYLKLMMNE